MKLFQVGVVNWVQAKYKAVPKISSDGPDDGIRIGSSRIGSHDSAWPAVPRRISALRSGNHLSTLTEANCAPVPMTCGRADSTLNWSGLAPRRRANAERYCSPLPCVMAWQAPSRRPYRRLFSLRSCSEVFGRLTLIP